jgi:hypothetical protein
MDMDELSDGPDRFSPKMLPHFEGLSESQDTLITLLNAATSIDDPSAKRLLFEKVCQHIGVTVSWPDTSEQG